MSSLPFDRIYVKTCEWVDASCNERGTYVIEAGVVAAHVPWDQHAVQRLFAHVTVIRWHWRRRRRRWWKYRTTLRPFRQHHHTYSKFCSDGSITADMDENTDWKAGGCSLTPTATPHSFNGVFSGTTWVSWYQKDKTSLDLNEVRDDGVLGCSGISWTMCKQSAPSSRQITTPTPHHSMFTGRMLFLTPSQQCQSTHIVQLYNGLGNPPPQKKIAPSPGWSRGPSDTWFLGPPDSITNGILTVQVFLCGSQ